METATELDNINDWYMIFQLLSMDMVTPLLPEMGIKLASVDVLKMLCREFIEEYSSQNDRIENAQILSLEQKRVLLETWEAIALQCPPPTLQILVHWKCNTLRNYNDAIGGSFLWERLLMRLGGINNLSYPCASLALNPGKLETIITAIQEHLGGWGDVVDRITMMENSSKTVWDQNIFASCEPHSPMTWVLDIIHFVNFTPLWLLIQRLLGQAEKDLLLQWAKSQAKLMSMPAEIIEWLEIGERKDDSS